MQAYLHFPVGAFASCYYRVSLELVRLGKILSTYDTDSGCAVAHAAILLAGPSRGDL